MNVFSLLRKKPNGQNVFISLRVHCLRDFGSQLVANPVSQTVV